jgi:spermidine/putrescine-binding protein
MTPSRLFRFALSWLAPVVAPFVARAADELNLFGWSEYVPQPVIEGFTKETGIKVNFETFSSNEELISKLVAGGSRYDLVQPSDYAAEVMIPQNSLRRSIGRNCRTSRISMPRLSDAHTIPRGNSRCLT